MSIPPIRAWRNGRRAYPRNTWRDPFAFEPRRPDHSGTIRGARPKGAFSPTPAAGGNRRNHRAGRESLLAHSRAGGSDRKTAHVRGVQPIETQEAFDVVIKKRIEWGAKETERLSDYDDLKSKAARLVELEATGNTELDAARTFDCQSDRHCAKTRGALA